MIKAICKIILGIGNILGPSLLVLVLKGYFISPLSLVATLVTKGGTTAAMFCTLYIITGIINIVFGFIEIWDKIIKLRNGSDYKKVEKGQENGKIS